MTGNTKSSKEGALCASCDRCRSRKTKCDGKSPCGGCSARYLKKNKLTSMDGIELSEIECVYSPAKRRGPIPGRSTSKKTDQVSTSPASQQPTFDWQQSLQNPPQSNVEQTSVYLQGMDASQMSANALLSGQQKLNLLQSLQGGNTLQQQAQSLQQQQQQQQQQHAQYPQQQNTQPPVIPSLQTNGFSGQPRPAPAVVLEPNARRARAENQHNSDGGLPRTIEKHSNLLKPGNSQGERLRAFFNLSINELYQFPPTPSDHEFCRVNGLSALSGAQLAALSASRFAEVALGALVHNEVGLALELCNAVVHCLREAVASPTHKSYTFIVAKTYFFLGVFRACRGDMDRYFKYRRVSMTYLGKLENEPQTLTMIAAIAYLDAWAYMTYNANDQDAPDADTVLPIACNTGNCMSYPTATEMKYNTKTDVSSVATDPKNKTWIQGPPPVYLNNEAPLHARAVDALACAVRTCCDQANSRFAMIDREAGVMDSTAANGPGLATPTSTAVMAHENELCSRNIVLSAYSLVQQSNNAAEGSSNVRNDGLQLVISAMDAFLENSEEGNSGGFTDSQIQSLLCVCGSAIENPLLLQHAGPTYHMATNACVLLSHLLNGLHASKMQDSANFGKMEQSMFDEVLDCYISMRKLLTVHRRKLPVILRCHALPRPNFSAPIDSPLIDLGETLLCGCRGCQGFVLMACSPCVAAERARAAEHSASLESVRESQVLELGDLDQELDLLGAEFDVDDDALLGMISSLVS